MRCSGHKEVLELWIEQTEGAKFWLWVMNELKTRGTPDILIAVVDGLKGFPEAITAVFPDAIAQDRPGAPDHYSLQFVCLKGAQGDCRRAQAHLGPTMPRLPSTN